MSEPGLTINSLCHWHLEIFLSNLSTEEWAALKSLSKRKDAVIKAAHKRRRGSCLADRPLPTKISPQPTKKLSKKLFRISLTNNNYQWPVTGAQCRHGVNKIFREKKGFVLIQSEGEKTPTWERRSAALVLWVALADTQVRMIPR